MVAATPISRPSHRTNDTNDTNDTSVCMNRHLRDKLLHMQERDLAMRDVLRAAGGLEGGYHPQMEALHQRNAQQLATIIAEFGWPHTGLVGDDGAEAAWLVAQHAIGEPAFMRECRTLLAAEVALGRAPVWQLAYLEDRICVFEGRAQRFGTQFEITPTGPILYETEEPAHLNGRRRAAGLEPIEERLSALIASRRPTPEAYTASKRAETIWRERVGWPGPRRRESAETPHG
jgi:hypothetical protein